MLGWLLNLGFAGGEALDITPWTKQTDATTTWSDQTDAPTTWTAQSDDSATWTEQ